MTDFRIIGTNGDEAEAESFTAARVACRTLVVDDGNERATILLDGRWVGDGALDERGAFVFHTTQGRERG